MWPRAYDGAKRRCVKKTYASGQLDETRHFYYTEPSRWQVIEERIGSSMAADRQFVWGLRYIDDLVLRDRDTDDDGTLDERRYGIQDANWNVTGVINQNGTVQERFAYCSYGLSIVLTPIFTIQPSSEMAWGVHFAGYHWDVETRLFHIRNRVYHPTVGIWLQRDPIGMTDSVSLYSYVRANPLTRVDPLGLQTGVLEIPVLVIVLLFVIIIIWLVIVMLGGLVLSRSTRREVLPRIQCDPREWYPPPIPPPIEPNKNCATEFPDYPLCPTNMYKDEKDACKGCNNNQFRPDRRELIESPHFKDPAVHVSCLRSGPGDRLDRLGISVICGLCCREVGGIPIIDSGCICALGYDD